MIMVKLRPTFYIPGHGSICPGLSHWDLTNGPTKLEILGPEATHEKPMIRAAVTGIKGLKPERAVLWLSL